MKDDIKTCCLLLALIMTFICVMFYGAKQIDHKREPKAPTALQEFAL